MIYGEEETTKLISQVLNNTNIKCDTYTNSEGPILLTRLEQLRKGMENIHSRGIKIRCISEITVNNINHCKELMEMAELRHLDGVNGYNVVNGTEYISTIHLQEVKPFSYLIYSNVQELVEQQQLIFDGFWNRAVSAEQKISEIEQIYERIDIVPKSSNAEQIYLDLLKLAKNEIILLFPTTNAFLRQHKLGVVDLIADIAINKNIKVRVLVPKNRPIEKLIEQTKSQYNIINSINNIEFRYIQQLLETGSTVLIVDNKESLVMELKDDTKEIFSEAIGLSVYSNSRPGVLSYVAIFENLWKETMLYQELEKSNEQLKQSETFQRDFIITAAHELKNPIQPILGLSGMLMNNKPVSENQLYNIIKIINRNAQRLLKLTNDILDIAKIETSSLILNKEIVNLRLFIMDNINEYINQVQSNDIRKSEYTNSYYDKKEDNTCAKLIFSESKKIENKNSDDELFMVEVDKSRVFQIMFNLLDNAYKFTDVNETINIQIEKEFAEGKEYAIITIKDTGKGIDSEIMPRLFTKFATKSDKGTGLGLFICKSIVEAHGGKIWAKNNEDGRGSSFSFSLPLYK